MTAPAGDRARRGRVLLVGSGALEAPLRRVLTQPPVCVPDLFHAIGEVLTAEASRPFLAAIVSGTGDAAAVRTAPAALKRIDPSLEVFLLGDAAGSAPVGYDDTIDANDDPVALAQRVGLDLVAGAVSASSSRAAMSATDVDAEASATSPERATSGSSGSSGSSGWSGWSSSSCASTDAAEPETRPPARGPAVSAEPDIPADLTRTAALLGATADDFAAHRTEPPESQAPPSPAQRPGSADTGLGDIDLVEAVLRDPAGVQATALALIGERTGFEGLAVTSTAGVAAAAPVSGTGDESAWLVSSDPAATNAALAPWATWIGHWLALDRSHRVHRSMAYHDDLTGAWNRRAFDRLLTETIAAASRRRQTFSVLVFDLDNFKHYNDDFGHAAGDTILCETVALLNSVIRTNDRVCRIGGDEFAVILADFDGPRTPGSAHVESIEGMVRRFQTQVSNMRFPKLGLDAPGSLSVSAGLATYPWDAIEGPDLLRIADHRALRSKRKGKDRITFGPEMLPE